MPSDEDIATVLMDLAYRRGSGKSFCPAEAARALCADWRPLMPRVRAVAARLQQTAQLQATQQGRPVDPETAQGPIRLRLAS